MRNELKTLVFAAAATVAASLAVPAAADAGYRGGHRFRYGLGRSYYSHPFRQSFGHAFGRDESYGPYGDGGVKS